MQWCSDIYVIKLNLRMAKNTKFYSGVNKTNTTCRINHAYALFLKILMHDFDVVVRKLCWGWNIFLLWNAEIEIYCYLNNSYTATIVYQHSLIYVNIYTQRSKWRSYLEGLIQSDCINYDVYMQHFWFYVSTGNLFLYNCGFACELVSNSWLMFIFFTLGTSHWIGSHVSGWSTAVYLG